MQFGGFGCIEFEGSITKRIKKHRKIEKKILKELEI